MSHTRINSIDVVRGLVILLMPLDHVRDLLHIDSLSQSPTDLSTTTPILFFSRWVTHFCAPVFIFLAGTSAQRYLSKQSDISFARKYLLKRGLLTILSAFVAFDYYQYCYHRSRLQSIKRCGNFLFGMDRFPMTSHTFPARV